MEETKEDKSRNVSKYSFICPNCGEEYCFFGTIFEFRCEICGSIVAQQVFAEVQ